MDEPEVGWKPSKELINFIEESKNKTLIYIGFGSIVLDDPKKFITNLFDASKETDVRIIFCEGWFFILKFLGQLEALMKK